MKLTFKCSLACAVAAAVLGVAAQTESHGMVDFGKFSPPSKGGEFVEIQVRSNLLQFAARLVEKEEPEAAKLLRSVQLVRVNVVGLTDENREGMQQRIQKVRHELESRGWERNVNVQDKTGEDVGIYTQTQGGEALAGVVITVLDPKNAVFVNVVGDIRPEQIVALGDSLHIQPLKELHTGLRH